MVAKRFTARARLETWAHASRVQSDEATYDLERTVVGSVVAGVTADRCGQCCACDRNVVPVAVGNWETGDMEVKPFCYLKQTTTDRNPPHGWAVHFTDGEVPLFSAPQPDMQETVERLRLEAERAWQEVDAIAKERDDHRRWRQDLADQLGEVEKHRDAIAIALNKTTARGEMLASVVQGAKEEFVKVPYGASHEDVAAINEWHEMAAEALAEWRQAT